LKVADFGLLMEGYLK